MRSEILKHLDAGGAGLDPDVRDARRGIEQGLSASELRRAGKGALAPCPPTETTVYRVKEGER
jgi:hypothetical protein